MIIGLSGLAGAGKDQIADYLIENHGWSGKVSFARNLKDMVKHAFKLSEYQVSDHEGKKSIFKNPVILNRTHTGAILVWICRTHKSIDGGRSRIGEVQKFITSSHGRKFSTPREILQFVGTDICRFIVQSYHIDVLHRKLLACNGNWIITDVRFPDEAKMVQSTNGLLIRVERPSLSLSDVYRHSSETSLNDWNQWNSVILNDTPNVEGLYTKVDKFLEETHLCRKIIP